jgi:hypothetical protein
LRWRIRHEANWKRDHGEKRWSWRPRLIGTGAVLRRARRGRRRGVRPLSDDRRLESLPVIRFALISKMVILSISSPGAMLTVTDGVRTLDGTSARTKGHAKKRNGRCYRGERLIDRCDRKRTTCAADAFVVSDRSCPSHSQVRRQKAGQSSLPRAATTDKGSNRFEIKTHLNMFVYNVRFI